MSTTANDTAVVVEGFRESLNAREKILRELESIRSSLHMIVIDDFCSLVDASHRVVAVKISVGQYPIFSEAERADLLALADAMQRVLRGRLRREKKKDNANKEAEQTCMSSASSAKDDSIQILLADDTMNVDGGAFPTFPTWTAPAPKRLFTLSTFELFDFLEGPMRLFSQYIVGGGPQTKDIFSTFRTCLMAKWSEFAIAPFLIPRVICSYVIVPGNRKQVSPHQENVSALVGTASLRLAHIFRTAQPYTVADKPVLSRAAFLSCHEDDACVQIHVRSPTAAPFQADHMQVTAEFQFLG